MQFSGSKGCLRLLKLRKVAAFAAEADDVGAKRSQQGNAAKCETFRTRNGPRQREFRNKVRAAGKRLSGTCPFGENCRFPALNEISAHHDRNSIRAEAAHIADQQSMPVMKRIIFGNHPGKCHIIRKLLEFRQYLYYDDNGMFPVFYSTRNRGFFQ